jgi:hypothetical protein
MDNNMEESFEMERSERKSLFFPNALWVDIRMRTKDKMSISKYIKEAVIEKMKREDSEK